MRVYKIFTGLLLYVATMLPQYALADTFCTVIDGAIHITDCAYTSYDACKREAGEKGDCIADQKDESAVPYCVITWGMTCQYHDLETCNKSAEAQMGSCIQNPNYKGPKT